MKKLFNVKSLCAILLCFVMIVSLCACTDTEQNASTYDDASTPTTSVSSVDEVSSDEETSIDTTTQTPSQDAISSDESSSTTQTPTQSGENSKVESTVTSSTPVTSTTPSTPETTKPKTNAELILGKWRGSYDMAPMLSEMGFGTIEGTAIVSCDIEFTSSGIFYENIDRASAESAYRNVFTQMLNNALVEEGYTKEQFEAENGITFDEYISLLVDTVMESLPQTIINAYKFEGNDLYIRTQDDVDFVKNEYRFDGDNTITITEDGESITYTRIG